MTPANWGQIRTFRDPEAYACPEQDFNPSSRFLTPATSQLWRCLLPFLIHWVLPGASGFGLPDCSDETRVVSSGNDKHYSSFSERFNLCKRAFPLVRISKMQVINGVSGADVSGAGA